MAPAPGPVLTPGPVVTPADPWAEAMSAFATDDNADAHAGGVVFVGSSSIRLWADLEKRYSSYAAVNRGFGGSTLADCVKHMDRLVLPHKPRLVVIYAGDNDLAGGRSPDQVLLDFVELTSRISERLPKTQIVFVSIKPSPARIDLLSRVRDTNTRIRDYVATKRYLRYIDVFTPMLDAQGKPRGELFGGDSLHLNEEGYALWHALISPVLPTDEQPAMVKGPERKEVPLVVKEAGARAGPSPVAQAGDGSAPKPAAKVDGAPKAADARKSTSPAMADAKPAPAKEEAGGIKPAAPPASPGPNVAAVAATPALIIPGSDRAPKPAAAPDAGKEAAVNLPKAPDSPQTVRATVYLADAPPAVPASPPFAQPGVDAEGSNSAEQGEVARPTDALAPAETKEGPVVEVSASEIAKLPGPPRTVRANVVPADVPPASPRPDASGTPSATSEPQGVSKSVLPATGSLTP